MYNAKIREKAMEERIAHKLTLPKYQVKEVPKEVKKSGKGSA